MSEKGRDEAVRRFLLPEYLSGGVLYEVLYKLWIQIS